ncbi:MAG: M23 family metallopeptidase [Oscillospiraceae bacterium]|nr:M23 family metallopeptidase [Oscillospiraceae bacterium]MBR2739405.1 M23 family metallopeptidase [Oscillospiraceae bacterium]
MGKKKREILAITAVLLIAASAGLLFLLNRSKGMALARQEAALELLGTDAICIGDEVIKPVQADAEIKNRIYTVNPGEPGIVRITDMEQSVIFLPDDAVSAEITVFSGEETVFSGSEDDFRSFYPENGRYRLGVQCRVQPTAVTSKGEEFTFEGTEEYIAELEYDVSMKISFESDRIREGSVMTVNASGVRGEVVISAGEVLAPFPLVTDERGYGRGLFSVSYITPPGTYTGFIETREGTSEFSFTIEEEQYTVQHLIISEETQSATIGNSDNRDAYNEMIDKTYYSWYPERFYDDCFTLPVDGEVTTEFGLFRYTNDNPVPTRHAGVDLAEDEGTPVLAAASGYVIAAGYNGVSGNTVVIDHGFGVRTYYFHMAELCVREGEFVEEGIEIGKVGATGYATGPHLHFNLMVHDNSVDPWAAFNGTSGIFGLDLNSSSLP